MNSRFEEKKTKMVQMANKAGFKSIHQLCEAVGISEANLYTNLKGRFNMSVKRMFKIANILNCPVIKIIEIFYPNEIAENKNVILFNTLDYLSMQESRGVRYE